MADFINFTTDQDCPWARRILNGNKYYQAWESKYRCDTLRDYMRGFQWKYKKDFNSINYNPYTLNLFNSTLKIKLATFLFQKPSFVITPEPGDGQSWDLDLAMKSAEIKQNVLNTIVQNKNMNFTKHVKRAAKDSFSSFGLIEVGYAADWRNPQKEIPELKSWDSSDISEEKDKVINDDEVPINERFYIKRINPKRFRVAVSEAIDLNDHEWCGYFDFVYTRELQKTKGINWPNGYTGGSLAADYSSGILGDTFDRQNRSELLQGMSDGRISKVWHIWDMVSKKRILFLDQYFNQPLWEQDIERLPFIDLRWDENDEGFWPIPPAFQWVSQQDEINEAREQTRSYRRRFTRKFQFVKGQIDQLEVEKFTSGPDGVAIEVKEKDAITPIENPEQGQTAENALLLAKDDFNTVSGTSQEARGQSSDRETATAARIVDARASIRESAEQLDFEVFIGSIGSEILATAKERLVDGLWVKYSSGATDTQDVASLMAVQGPIFKFIKSQDLRDGYDESIVVDVENKTPQAMAASNQSFAQFLTYVHNFPEIALDPDLIREAAFRCNYRNEKVIAKMQKTALMMMAQQALQNNGGGTPGSGGLAVQQDQGQNANNIAVRHIQQMDPGNPQKSAQKSLESVM